jgi:cell division protein FtsW
LFIVGCFLTLGWIWGRIEDMQMKKRLSHNADYTLIILFGALVVFGLVMLSSASSVIGYDKFQDSYWYLKHQLLLGFLPGLFLFIILSRIDYRIWKRLSLLFLWISLGLLVLVFMPGISASYGKARSWINIGGFSLQPAEMVKLTLLLYLAFWLERRRERVQSFAHGVLPFMIYLILVGVLIILQPDIGTLSIILLTSFVLLYLAGARLKHLAILLVGFLTALAILIKIAPYRLDRLTAFINPNFQPEGIGYQVNQALLAIGSGGWFGLGLGHSNQKFQYLPEVVGDSIFAIIAEELGFVMIVILILVFLAIFYRIVKIAKNAPDFFGYLVAMGIGTWILGQFFVNIGAMARLLPLTGLPLPLISYGGTAMATTMAALGIVVNISKYTRQTGGVSKFRGWKR